MKNRFYRGITFSVIALLLVWGHISIANATEYSASFKNADINEFVNIVGKNLNKTIILDPAVRGSINVRSYDLLNERQYYQFFLNVLEVYGFAVVEMNNGIVKVIKAKDAKVAAIPVIDDGTQFSGDEMVTRVVPVINVSVRELAPLLRQLNDNAGGGNVVHYDPANVIMITGRAAVVNRLVKIIQRVDKAGDKDVDIVRLKYASALEMVKVVSAIQSPTSSKSSSSNVLQPRLVADERTNSIIISGEPKTRARIVKLIGSLDSELKNDGNTRVFYLKYAKAEKVVDVLKGVSKTLAGSGSSKTSSKTASSNSMLSIEAHEGTNSIVVSAQPALMSSLSNIIRQLDIRRAQVLVEAIVAEVSESDGINLSTQWGSTYGGSQFNDNGVTTGELINAAYDIDENDDFDSAASALSSIAGGILGIADGNWGVVLQALSSSTSSNILATPSITTLDNQEASFIVGDEVPVLTGSTSSATNDNPFQTIERKDIGIKLKVTPQINEGDAVQMVIEQEVSTIKGQTSVDIIFATRAVKTTVLAKSGETVIIGGLIDEDVNESEDKVPFLGDLPVVGFLFKSTKSSTEKRNLMIFIRATIIRDDKTMKELSTRKYGLMRKVQQARQDEGINLMPNSLEPILPEWGSSYEIDPSSFDHTSQQSINNSLQDIRQ